MVSIKVFLESSTIHGLTYISTTRKCTRLFWILVVIAGFMGAGFLIEESFASWSESPIRTTIETLPISEIKFPKVVVCPPKNTFTDLNYDLIITYNLTLTDEMRDEMFKDAIKILEDDVFTLSKGSLLEEADRFYNWYHGFTEIQSPNVPPFGVANVLPKIEYNIFTSATSGVVNTQYYGRKFQSDMLETQLDFTVRVYPPMNGNETILKNENVTLHFKVEKALITKFSRTVPAEISVDRFHMTEFSDLEDNQNKTYKNFTFESALESDDYEGGLNEEFDENEYDEYDDETTLNSTINQDVDGNYIKCSLYRGVYPRDAEKLKMEVMPGFKIRWWYTGAPVIPDPLFKNNVKNNQFIR